MRAALSRHGLPRSAVALGGVFLLLGFAGGSWISAIPAVQSDLDLGNGVLGLAFVGLPVGSVLATVALPTLLTRWGSRHVVIGGVVATAFALLLPGVAGGALALALALTAFGAATGGLDVAMNTHGIEVEQAVGRSVFGRLHALWSLGGFVAAGVGALLQHVGVGAGWHLAGAAAVVLGLGIPVAVTLTGGDPHPPGEANRAARRWSRDRMVVVLACVSVAAFVVEVLAADWGGVLVRRNLAGSSTAAAGAYAAFALPHFLVRIAGDPLVDRLRLRRLLTTALVVAAVGLVVVVTAPGTAVAYAGLAVTGAGIGLVVPAAFGAAGRVPGVPAGAGVATAAGASYLAWCVAPPLVGGLSTVTGLRVALLVGPLLAAAALVAARRIPDV